MAEYIIELFKTYGATAGYVMLFAIIFAESGLFFGFFLPGDSLLLTVGLLASQPELITGRPFFNLWLLLPIVFLGAVLGDNVGYWFGAKAGPKIFSRDESLLFRRKNLLAAKAFYDKHGGKTIVLARFMPFIRTFAPIVAGAVEMEYKRFFFFNLIGGLSWGVGVTVAGYFIGNIPGVEKYFTYVVIAVIIISALPAMIHIWNDSRHEFFSWIRKLFNRRAARDTESDL